MAIGSRASRSLRLLAAVSRARLRAFEEAEQAGELLDGTPAVVALIKAEARLWEHDRSYEMNREPWWTSAPPLPTDR